MIKVIFYLIFISTAFALSLLKVYEPDCFWHLKTGEIILKTWSIPRMDPFSFVTAGERWIPQEFLSEVVFYIVHYIGGFTFLGVFSGLLFVAGFFLVFIMSMRRGLSLYLAFVVAFTGVLISQARVQPRPQVFTYFFLPLMILIIDEFRLRRKKYIYFLPIIFLFWINFHPGAVIGLGIFASFMLMEVLKFYLNSIMSAEYSSLRPENVQTPESLKIMGIVFLCSLAISFLNPNFHHVYDFLFRHPDVVQKIPIHEFQPINPEEAPLVYNIIVFSIIISLFGFRKNLHELPAALFLGLLLFKMRRFMVEYSIVGLPAAGMAIQLLLSGIAGRLEKSRIPALMLFKGIRAIAFCGTLYYALYSTHYAYANDYYDFFGFGLSRKYYPQKAMEFIEKKGLKPRMYNSANFGGALIYYFYPQQRVFQDTRLLSYEKLIKFQEGGINEMNFHKILEYYDVNYAILDVDTLVLTKTPDALPRDKWALVYFDDTAEILVRRIPENEHIYKGREYIFVNPEAIEEVASAQNVMVVSLLVELRRALNEAPHSFRLHYALGALLAINKDPSSQEEAEKELVESLKILPGYPPANKALAELLMFQGRYEEAIKYYEKYVGSQRFKRSPLLPDLLNELGVLYVRAGNLRKAKKLFREALALEPGMISARENLKSLERGMK